MQFITSLFGGFGNSFLTAAFALGAVILAILLALWLMKVVFRASGNVVRGRNRRLAVVDTLALDPKRQLLLVRRDNVEHLILTGGAQDLVVEAGIPVADSPAVQPARRPVPMVASRRPAKGADKPIPAGPPVEPAVTPPPAPANAQRPAAPATAIERLRELGQPVDKRAHLSLRHTGLLRPVSEMEMAVSPENANGPNLPTADSAKEEATRHDAEGNLVDDIGGAKRN